MAKRSRFRHILSLSALGLLALLLLLPATGWLLRLQLRMELLPQKPIEEATAFHAVASRFPNDYPMQLADALTVPSQYAGSHLALRQEQLQRLAQRFPDNPSVYANLLRILSVSILYRVREEDYLLTLKPGAPLPDHTLQPSKNADPWMVVDVAAKGERLEPDNAYFTLMRTVGLFAMHHDTEALDAIHRAASKSHWEDYLQDEMVGEFRLAQKSYGDQSAMDRYVQWEGVSYPHLSSIRKMARIATYKAVQAEQSGHIAEGFAIRHDLMRCGSVMRCEARSVMGETDGKSLTLTAMIRPGGIPYVPLDSKLSSLERNREYLKQYCLYLKKIGCGNEVNWVQAEIASDEMMQAILSASYEKDPCSLDMILTTTRWWGISLLLLANLLTLFCLTGFLYVAARVSDSKLAWLWRSLIVLSGTILLVLWQCHAISALLASPMGDWMAYLCMNIDLVTQSDLSSEPPVAVCVSCFAAPLLLTGMLGFICLVSNAPLVKGIARGLRVFALPTACLLLLSYCASILMLSRYEATIEAGVHGEIQHEGRYRAQLCGKPWPARSRLSSE